MPTLKTQCPECDAKVKLTVDEPGEHEMECPKCGHEFSATLPDEDEKPKRKPAKAARRRDQDDEEEDERPAKYKRRDKDAGKSKTPIVIGAVAGVLLLVGGVVGLVVAFSGSDKKPTAQNDPAPKAKPQPNTPPKVNPPANPNPNQNANQNPQNNPNDGMNGGDPPNDGAGELPVGLPGAGGPAVDVFARAASFKPDGPLPELPPLPPVDRRPMLALDPGGHTAFVRGVFFTPDNNRVISVSEDKSIRVWDIASGEPFSTIRMPAGPDDEGKLQAAALSSDGKWLAVGGFPMGAGKSGIPFYVFSLETGELSVVVDGASNAIRSLDFSADRKQIAVGCANGRLQVYDFPSKKWVYGVLSDTKSIKQVRFNPKRAMVAVVGGNDREVKTWDLRNNQIFATQVKLTEQLPNTVDWTADGDTLAVGCTSGELLLYDLAGKLLKTVPALIEEHKAGKAPMQIARMRLLPGDKTFVFGGVAYSGWAAVTDIATGKQQAILKEHSNTISTVNCSADGTLAVSAGGDSNEIVVWETKTGAVVRKFQSASKSLWAVGWGKDGKSLAWGYTNAPGADGMKPLEQTLRLDAFVPGDVPKSADYGRHIRAAGPYSIQVNDFFNFTVFENGKPLYKHKCRNDRLYSVTLLPGKGIVVGGSFAMYLIDTKTGNLIRDYRGDRGLTMALAPSPDGRYFLSGSTDQVLRVWTPDREEPVLSVFAAGREWIAWTPQGYYACSPYGERLIAWQVNNGIDKLPSVYPAVRFRASLYQPALVKYLIPAGDIRTAIAMANKFERQQIAATGLADVLPPGVTISAPQTADGKPITVRASAQGSPKNPIVSLRLLVDGRPHMGAAGVKRINKQVRAEVSWEVTLAPGSHTLAVLAESPVSKGMSSTLVVNRTGADALPNLYVVAVGISAYPGPMKLNYAASDAILLTSTLQEKSKTVFANIEMKLFTDKQGTKKNMREGLDWLKSKMTPKDVGIFFFSGHGGRDEDTGKFYLIPVDIGRDIEQTGFSGDELKSRLEDMPGRLVAILDACHSGAVAEIRPAQADGLVRDLMTDDYGVIVLASSLGREYSLESPLTKAGFYTLGLAEGMHGRADFNRDGVVYLNELVFYASLRVQQLSGGRQNPTLGRPPNVRPFPIAKP